MEVHFVHDALHNVDGRHSEGVDELHNLFPVFGTLEVVVDVLFEDTTVDDLTEGLEVTDTGRTAQEIVVHTQFVGGEKEHVAVVATVNAVHNREQVFSRTLLVIATIEAEVFLEFVEEEHAVVVNRRKEVCETVVRLVADDDRETEFVGKILCRDGLTCTLRTVEEDTKVVLELLSVVGIHNVVDEFFVDTIKFEAELELVGDSLKENFTRHRILNGLIDAVVQRVRHVEISLGKRVNRASLQKNFSHIKF